MDEAKTVVMAAEPNIPVQIVKYNSSYQREESSLPTQIVQNPSSKGGRDHQTHQDQVSSLYTDTDANKPDTGVSKQGPPAAHDMEGLKSLKQSNRKLKQNCLSVITKVEKQIEQVLALRREEKAFEK
jgi:hypothetical protein